MFNKEFFINGSVTFILLFMCVLLFFIPGSSEALSFNGKLILNEGQWWRFFSSPFVHVSLDHLLWNMITLALTTFICEQIDRKFFLYYVVIAIAMTGAYKLIMSLDGFSLGYSNIAAGSFALLLMMVAKQGWDARDMWITLVPVIILLLFTGYELTLFGGATPWELFTGTSISGSSGIQLKSGHIVGILTGLVCGLYHWFFIKIQNGHNQS